MFKRVWIVAALLLPLAAWAADLKTHSALTVDSNATTEDATAKCDISVTGVDRKGTYSGVMRFVYEKYNEFNVEVFYAVFQVDPLNPTWTESSPGVYTVTAQLKRQVVAVQAQVPVSLDGAVRIYCDSRIDAGTQPPALGATIYAGNLYFGG